MQSPGSGPTAKKTKPHPGIYHIFLGISCLVLFVVAVTFFYHAGQVVVYPYEWSTMDGYYVFHGNRLLAGKPIYFGYQSLLMPFEYVPLYPAFIGVLAKLFGRGVWYERTFSLLCALGMAGVVASAVKKRTHSNGAALMAGLLFFGPASISVWYIVRGIDLFAAFLAISGVAVAAGSDDHSAPRLAAASVILIFAFYAKQTTIFPAAAAISFILSRNFKKGIVTGISYAVGVSAVFLVIQALSGGWFFENAFLTTSRNPYHWGRFVGLARDYFRWVPFVFAIATIQAWRGVSRRPDAWTLYFFFTLLSTLLAGKAGAALSYFVPLYSATCICAGLFVGDLSFAEKRHSIFSIVLLSVLIVQCMWFFEESVSVPNGIDFERARRLNEYIRDHPGEILSERIDSFLVLNGRELNVEPVQLPSLIIRGAFDQETLARPIRGKDFSLIIYSGMYFRGLPEVRTAIFENYKAIDRIDLGLFYGETLFTVMEPR